LTLAHPGYSTRLRQLVCAADDPFRNPHIKDIDMMPTSYLGINGRNQVRPDGLLYFESRHSWADVRDGLSQTLLIGERPHDFAYGFAAGSWYGGWVFTRGTGEVTMGVEERNIWSIVGSAVQVTNCPDGPYRFQPGSFRNPCSAFHFWSLHPGGANFVFADGSVRFLPYSAADVMPALASRAGGEVVSVDW
jgi:prepilin-type processing-associated H-X9-DG protein